MLLPLALIAAGAWQFTAMRRRLHRGSRTATAEIRHNDRVSHMS